MAEEESQYNGMGKEQFLEYIEGELKRKEGSENADFTSQLQ